ncbi:RNA helicase, partial [Streptomyces sp. ASQP_92]|nr:RNA helicase [Streptomyces sp. ASQP_92]
AAGITPTITQVRSGEAELSRITGAKAPSGIPVGPSGAPAERPKQRGQAPFRGRGTARGQSSGRPGNSRRAGESREMAEARKAARARRAA